MSIRFWSKSIALATLVQLGPPHVHAWLPVEGDGAGANWEMAEVLAHNRRAGPQLHLICSGGNSI